MSSAVPHLEAAQQHSLISLLHQAQKALDDLLPSLALQFITRAIETHPSSPSPLPYTLLGVAHMDLMQAAEDDPDASDGTVATSANAAIDAFQRAVELDVQGKEYEPLLYLGQMGGGGLESLEWYRRGVEVIERRMVGEDDERERMLMEKKMSDALCSMAEIFMTDCCDEPDAEASCERYALRACEVAPSNPDAYSTLASLRLSQCRPDDARTAIQTSMDLWYISPSSLFSPVPPSSPSSSSPSSSSPSSSPKVPQPAYPARLNLVKLLLELGLHIRALDVLRTVEEENDEDPEGWYLYGWCLYRMGGGGVEDEELEPKSQPGDRSDRGECWVEAHECFEHFLQLYERFGAEEGMREHCEQLMSEIAEYLEANPVQDRAMDEDEVDYERDEEEEDVMDM
ncbi:hypothetical protein HKX48_003278 [Thoreauomyces humboldtii]|nr:hypothetical protein HKX48_003278 [Thoreauomyces humboldtii]